MIIIANSATPAGRMSKEERPYVFARLRRMLAGTVLAALASLGWPAMSLAEPVDISTLLKHAEAFHESIGAATERLSQSRQERRKVLAQLLPTLSVDATLQRRPDTIDATSGTQTFTIRPKESRELTLRLTQPLYTGGRATTRLKISDMEVLGSDLALRQTRETLILKVATAYFEVLKAEEDLAAVRERHTAMQRHQDAMSARVRLGAAIRGALLRIQAEVAQLQANELSAQHEVETARANLSLLTGDPPGVELAPPPSLERLTQQSADLETAMRQRADLMVARSGVEASRLGIRYTTGNFLPYLSAEGVYAHHTETPSSSFQVQEETYAGVTATWKLFSGGEDVAERRRARSAFQEKSYDYDRLKREVRVEVEDAERQVAVAAQIVQAYENALASAEENHRIVTETFNAGAATYLDVLDASTTLGDARRNLANARYQHSIALLQLGKATGQLLTLIGESPAIDPQLERLRRGDAR